MEKLEQVLAKAKQPTEVVKSSVEVPLYEGFRKIEDKLYMSGTSIKYWM